jgi:glycosyltransferase involved in cell wall biosynthesis
MARTVKINDNEIPATKVFFQDIGCLDEYNFGLTTSLVHNENLSVTIGALTIHTFLQALRFKLLYKKSLKNLKTMLMGPPLSDKLKWITAKSLAHAYEKYFLSFDVLHLNNLSSFYIKSAIKVNKPRILSFHDSTLAVQKTIKKTNYLSEMLSFMDFVTTPSKFMAKIIEEKLNYEPVVIQHGVNTQLFNQAISKFSGRKYLGISEDAKVVFWSSRLSPEKDLKTLVDAVPKVVKEVPSVLFLIAGRSVGQKYYRKGILKYVKEKMKNEKGSHAKFFFKYIPHEKMPIYYRSADVFVHTTRLEAFGLVLIEAMACKLPLVTTNAGCCPEVIGDAGLLFEPGDSQDLAEKIITILTDESLRTTLVEKAHKRVLANFTWDKAAKQFSKLYLRAKEGK